MVSPVRSPGDLSSHDFPFDVETQDDTILSTDLTFSPKEDESNVISSSVSELRGALPQTGASRPEKNSSSSMVRSESVYMSVRKTSGSQCWHSQCL